MPEVDIDVDEPLVRRLLVEQFAQVEPAAASAPLTFVARGWDNAMFRLGDSHVVRLPVRAEAAPLIANEARCLPVLAEMLPVACPVPVFVGSPNEVYPWAWLIAPWIEGHTVALLPITRRASVVDGLAAFVTALHVPAPPDAPVNPYRGVPLVERAPAIDSRWSIVDAEPARGSNRRCGSTATSTR